jgi:hypothetical protein
MNFFDIKENINGDAVIGFTSHKEWKTSKFVDSTTLSSYFLEPDGQQHTKYLGLINLFATTENVSVPMMRDMFKNSAVLEVEPGQSITYDLKVNREGTKCQTVADTSSQSDKPGIEETVFEIVLNKEYQKGDILTYDVSRGAQFMIDNDHDPEPFGEGFKHYVKLSSTSKSKWFPADKLKPGIQYFKVGHVMGEHEVDFSSIDFNGPSSGSIRCEFLLGDPRAVETFYTAKSANMKSQAMKTLSDQVRQDAVNRLDEYGGKDGMFVISKNLGGGKMSTSGALVGTTLEYLVLAEIAKLEAYSLAFARAGVFTTAQGTKRINEGLYQQQRRGKLIKYSRPGGITMDHVRNAAAYIFKNSKTPIDQRRIKFRVGSMAWANMEQLFREYLSQQATALPSWLFANDKKLAGNLLEGNMNTGLTINTVKFTGVKIPGVGTVEMELDDTMDYDPMVDRQSRGFFGHGYARTSYSMVIEDATNPANSNVESKVNGASLVEGGAKNANIYYIRPEGGSVVYGYEQGRMADGGKTAFVQSSMKQAARTFWATSTSAALMIDTTRYITIELQDESDL